MAKISKKLILLTIVIDIAGVVIATLIMKKNGTFNLVDDFNFLALLILLALFLLPSLIPAMVASKIKKNSEKKVIIKQSIFISAILIVYWLILEFILRPIR